MRELTVPRVPLLAGPTPLMRLERFSRAIAPNGPTIWMKRDDLTPLAMGGNKLRKLEYLLGEALEQGADTVITLGAVQSNHACQTAAAARRYGLKAVLLLRGPRAVPSTGNLLLDHLFGAHILLDPHPPSDWGTRVAEELRQQGRRPYLIPYGGSNATGALGYVAAGIELACQLEEMALSLDEIVVTSSSGGTQAGLVVAHAAGHLRPPILGISVDPPASELTETVYRLATETARRIDMPSPARHHVRVTDAYVGPGYAQMNEATREAILLIARTEGIITDPVYTGKALSGLVDFGAPWPLGGRPPRALLAHRRPARPLRLSTPVTAPVSRNGSRRHTCGGASHETNLRARAGGDRRGSGRRPQPCPAAGPRVDLCSPHSGRGAG
ncbi:MAG: D-cysteine desulfhydrase family protein [Ardenticatenia bacterium]|nr:D-cysteine desulfhydrase family protein [Ardenticatenia bacterium]